MKKTLVISLSLFFVSHTALVANEEGGNTEEIYAQATQDENSEHTEKATPSDEELEAKRVAEEASEVAHAEEIEMREVGAGEEEPIMEE